MAPNVTVSFFDPADINGTPLLTITDEDTYFKGLKLQPDLYGVGGWQLTLARAWGFALLGSEAMQSEVFVRFLVHAYSETDWFYGGVLNKKDLTVVDRDEIGAEELVIGGSGPKAYLERYLAGIEQLTGTGFNLDLANGVWRWNENATAGRILNRFVAEDLAHSPATPDLTRSFNDTHDSNGDVWVDDIAGPNDWETPIGTSLLQIIWDLEDLSDTLITTIDLGTVSDPTFLLNAWQSYGEDVTGTAVGTGVCRIAEGINIANESLTVQGVAFRKATHVIVEGKDGVWVVEVKPSFTPGNFKKMAKIEYTRSSSEAILHKAGLRWLRRQDSGDSQYTVELVPGDDEAAGYYFPGPGSVLWVGNTVTLDTTADGSVHSPLDYNNADVLVTGIELELGPAGDDSTTDAAAKSWDLTVKLNHERAGFGGSPSQSSPGTDGGNGAGCKCPKLCKVHVPGDPPSETETVDKQFNADGDGGDSLNWTGLLSNQGPPGAAGSTHYYFKSTAPQEWSEVYAGSAGELRRIVGFIRGTTGERLKIGFFNGGVGTLSGQGAFLIGSATTLAIASHASIWQSFLVDVTTPTGTVGWALGRDGGGPDFDQVTVSTVAIDPGDGGQDGDLPADVEADPASGTGDSAARCDHVHAHGLLSDGGTHYHDTDQVEGLTGIELDDLADVDVPGPSDGDVLTFDSGSGDWVAEAGGSGGSGNVLALPTASTISIPGLALGDRVPASPGTYDEEFDGTADTLPTDWAWTSAPSGSDTWKLNSRWPSLLTVEGTGNTSYTLTRTSFTAAATFGIWAKVHVGPFSGADVCDLRMYAMNSGATEGRCVEYRATGGRASGVRGLRTISSAETVWGTEATGQQPGGMTMYMGFVRSSNNFEAWYSRDGIAWDQLAGSQSHTFTIDRIRFTIRTSTLTSLVGIDWIRYRTDVAFPRP